MAKFDVVVCGSATVDVFANTESELIEIRSADSSESLIAYPSGSKILIKELIFEIGGGGTNTAVAFSRMGCKTGYVGCLGDDENAARVLNLLKKEKISFLGHSTGEQTGYSIILDSIEHDRTILTYKGANDHLKQRSIKPFTTQWFYFSSMMNGSFSTQKKLAKRAQKEGINLAYNPSEYQAKQGYQTLKPILDATTVLIMNKEEAEYLAGFGTMDEILVRLHGFGIPVVCVTDGPRGVFAIDDAHYYSAKPSKVKVVETTGAGDAFASGFVSAYLKRNDVRDAIRVGIVNSESVITHYGAKNVLLSDRQARQRVKDIHVKRRKR
mgnify:CR=1 FL=1